MKLRWPIVYSSEEEKERVVEIGGVVAGWVCGLATLAWMFLNPDKFRALVHLLFDS